VCGRGVRTLHTPLSMWPREGRADQHVEAGPGVAAHVKSDDGERTESPSPERTGSRATSIVLTDTQAMEIYWLRALSDDHTTELQEIAGKSAIIAKLYEVSPKTVRSSPPLGAPHHALNPLIFP